MNVETRRDDIVETIFGVRVADPYRWLEDAANPEVQRWVGAQDRRARAYLARLPGRAWVRARLRAVSYLASSSAPVERGGRLFYERTTPQRDKPLYCWREGLNGDERVWFDPLEERPDGTLSVGVVRPSWDGRRVAFTVRENNADEAVLRVVDLETGRTIDTVEGARYADPQWDADGAGFFYTWLPPVGRFAPAERPAHSEVRYHQVGTPASQDRTVYGPTGNPTYFLDPQLGPEGRWLFLRVYRGWAATDLYLLDLHDQDAGWVPLAVGIEAHFDPVLTGSDTFYVLTDWEAPTRRLFRGDARHPQRDAWREVVAARPDAILEQAVYAGGRLALVVLRRASHALELRDEGGGHPADVALPGRGTVEELRSDPRSNRFFVGFTSFRVPHAVYVLDAGSGEPVAWSLTRVPLDASDWHVEQLEYRSEDGTPVTMWLLYRGELPVDGSGRVMLYGYGGFDVSLLPRFIGTAAVWVEAGGIFAMPNLRGGGEYGEAWHRAGMRENKHKVFEDFVAAAEALVARGITRPDRLAIRGGSNGGLLVGVALTRRPDLFKAVACAVPLLDMLRFDRFGSGKTWTSEYGDPSDPEAFRWLLAYSPYHHVVADTAYPAVLFLSADADDRVDPLHARKMAAALQWASSSGSPVLLRVQRHAGHGGAGLISANVEQYTDMLAFLMDETGLAVPSGR